MLSYVSRRQTDIWKSRGGTFSQQDHFKLHQTTNTLVSPLLLWHQVAERRHWQRQCHFSAMGIQHGFRCCSSLQLKSVNHSATRLDLEMNGKGNRLNSVRVSETYWPDATIKKYILGQTQINKYGTSDLIFEVCESTLSKCIASFFFFFFLTSLDEDRLAKFEFIDFKFTRSTVQMIFFFFRWWEQAMHADLLSTLSLALLERRAASVAWHSYRESSDSWALEISRLYWPMSRERSTRYLGQAAGDTVRTWVSGGGRLSLSSDFVPDGWVSVKRLQASEAEQRE